MPEPCARGTGTGDHAALPAPDALASRTSTGTGSMRMKSRTFLRIQAKIVLVEKGPGTGECVCDHGV